MEGMHNRNKKNPKEIKHTNTQFFQALFTLFLKGCMTPFKVSVWKQLKSVKQLNLQISKSNTSDHPSSMITGEVST